MVKPISYLDNLNRLKLAIVNKPSIVTSNVINYDMLMKVKKIMDEQSVPNAKLVDV